MFEASVYAARRAALATRVSGGVALFMGASHAPMNYLHNPYPFVQDGSFRYFFGIDRPDLAGMVDLATGEVAIFGDDGDLDDVIWFGPKPSLESLAEQVGVSRVLPFAELKQLGQQLASGGRVLHYLPPYRGETILRLADVLGATPSAVRNGCSSTLAAAVISLREIKEPAEIQQIEEALLVTRDMHHAAMAGTTPGRVEREIIGVMQGIARARGLQFAYTPIFTARGEVLHNEREDGVLSAGDLVVNDAGACSPLGYASDITRTLPVSGRFDPLQRRLYGLVLTSQRAAMDSATPGTSFLEVHKLAARVLVEGLAELGLFRGEPQRVVDTGAYALCFQCGLGHQIGLDVHDMESLGEDLVGYTNGVRRSELFGLRNLRMAKPLQPGMTLTVEPGLYFIPELIDRWRAEARHADLIDYDRFDAFRRFGGVRIEDDVVIEADGARILGPPIATTADEVEERMGSGR